MAFKLTENDKNQSRRSYVNKTPKRDKGKQTRDKIVNAANKLLLEEGYENFTLRKVAKNVGIEPGNLQYHFPTKRDLLWAVFLPELDNYQKTLTNAAAKGRSQTEKISEIVDFLTEDVNKRYTLCLWLPIWGLAAHDDEIAEMIREWYQTYINGLSSLLQDAVPTATKEKADETAVIITAQFDGMMIMFNLGKPRTKILTRAKKDIVRIIHDLLNDE